MPTPNPITRIDPQPVAYTTHAVLIAAVAVRSWSPTVGESRPSITCTPAFAALHATSSDTSSQAGVAAMSRARRSSGIAKIAAGPP